MAQKILVTPWELDTQLYCAPPRTFSESIGRKNTTRLQEQRRRSLFGCVSDQESTVSPDIQQQCLPMDLRGDRRVIKMIRDRKRKLFHSQLFDQELGMKKLYIQVSKCFCQGNNLLIFKDGQEITCFWMQGIYGQRVVAWENIEKGKYLLYCI